MYDFIMAGSGCAGMSLAYSLIQSSLKDKKILMIDKDLKQQNDRTWCFWTNESTYFDEIIYRTWDKIWFQSPKYSSLIQLHPYQYKMIRGVDFYKFCKDQLLAMPNVHFIQGEIQSMQSVNQAAEIVVDGQPFQGKWIFNSLPPSFGQKKQGYHYFKQHFKGWIIETPNKVFDPTAATFMDFRIEQEKEVRFFYILPFSETKALIEFTLFSEELLEPESYTYHLENYIREYMQITQYQIIEEEFGIIPMVDRPLKVRESDNILNIGTAGGMTKASSGYTFLNIQRQVQAIIQSLEKNKHPFYTKKSQNRFRLYDSMLLNVMAYRRYETRNIFANLFRRHPVDRALRFLDEKSALWEDLLIISQMPPLPFLSALGSIIRQRL